MRATICKKCGATVQDPLHKVICPKCKEFYKTQDEIDIEVSEIIQIISDAGKFEKIASLVNCGDSKHAYEELKKSTGFGCGLLEGMAVIDRLKNKKQTEPTYNQAEHEHNQQNAQQNAKALVGMTNCRICNHQISTKAESCPNCGNPTGVHVCPKCGSANTKVISGASKATSVLLWGVFAANKVVSKYQCKDCWHKF